LSVLTDESFFQGHLDYLVEVRRAVSLPVLRKDFLLDPYQIFEARAAGADSVLLIAECLDDRTLSELYQTALELGMSALIELYEPENLERVLEKGRETGIFLRFDMESSDYTTRTLDAFEGLWEEGWRNIGVVLQAYLKRTAGDVRRMIELGARVRLCKGAYAEPRELAFQDMPRVRESFIELMGWLLSEGRYPAIATHDESIIRAAREYVQDNRIPLDGFEFQMLHGVRRDLQQELLSEGFNVRVYVPFGEEWYPYLMRRMAERPENLMFMVGSVVKESPLGFLWRRSDRDGR
jgi:proline dehydrogenase